MKNTYASPLEINQLDWTRAWANRQLADYYRGLIAFISGINQTVPKRPVIVAGQIVHCLGRRFYKRLFMAYSAASEAVSLTLPQGDWDVLADAESSFAWQKPRVIKASARRAVLPRGSYRENSACRCRRFVLEAGQTHSQCNQASLLHQGLGQRPGERGKIAVPNSELSVLPR